GGGALALGGAGRGGWAGCAPRESDSAASGAIDVAGEEAARARAKTRAARSGGGDTIRFDTGERPSLAVPHAVSAGDAPRRMEAPPLAQADLLIPTLGEATIPSPLGLSTVRDDEIADFVPDDARVALAVETSASAPPAPPILFEKAGPRARILFEPART